MRIMITGGCGFLGTNIAIEAIRRSHPLLLLDNLSRQGSSDNLRWLQSHGVFEFKHADIRHYDDCEKVIIDFKPDVIFHLAGQVAMVTSLQRPRTDFEVNALGTLNILEAIRLHSPSSSLIYSSTNKVYGDLEHLNYAETADRYILTELPEGISEDMTLDFHSPYGCSKGSADQYVLDYARMFGLKTAVFRHSSMYGGRQFFTSDQGWIGWFILKALEQAGNSGSPDFTISGNGKQVRDLLHADDMVALYMRAAERINTISGQAFNVGGGPENSMSILELLNYTSELLGVKLNWRHIEVRNSDQRVFIADIRKVSCLLNWSPSITKEVGVQRMIEWVRLVRNANV